MLSLSSLKTREMKNKDKIFYPTKIKDIPNLENSLLFIEFDKSPYKDTYVLVQKYIDVLKNISLDKCYMIPDPDDNVDGFHIFIICSKIQSGYYRRTYGAIINEARLEAQKEVLREALETKAVWWNDKVLCGDHKVLNWCKTLISIESYINGNT